MGNKNADNGAKAHVRVLISGFDSFPGTPDNPSKTLVEALAEHFNNHSFIDLKNIILQTEYNSAYSDLENAIHEHRPDIVIAFGVSASAASITLESTARNRCGQTNDAAGHCPSNPVIKENGADTLCSTLPLEEITQALQQENISVALSDNAGDYLCNFLFYNLAHDIDAGKHNCIGGFVHIPHNQETAAQYTGRESAAALSANDLKQAGITLIETAAAQIEPK